MLLASRHVLSCLLLLCCQLVLDQKAHAAGQQAIAATEIPKDFLLRMERHNGSVPPTNRHASTYTLSADGRGSQVQTSGYFDQATRANHFLVPPDRLEELYAFLVAHKVFDTSWSVEPSGRVGGGCTWIEIAANRKQTRIPCEIPRELEDLKSEIVKSVEMLRSEEGP